MIKTNSSRHNKIWGAQKKLGTLPQNVAMAMGLE